MATQKVSVFGGAAFSSGANQTSVNTTLATVHATTPISVLYDHANNQASIWARLWAQSVGVPFVPLNSRLLAEGYVDPFAQAARFHEITNADAVHTFGSGPDVDAVVNSAVALGKTVTKH